MFSLSKEYTAWKIIRKFLLKGALVGRFQKQFAHGSTTANRTDTFESRA